MIQDKMPDNTAISYVLLLTVIRICRNMCIIDNITKPLPLKFLKSVESKKNNLDAFITLSV